MSNFPSTPHINVLNDIGFGKTVLMPGDPLRAKFIAENFFENPILVNNVRGVNGYTGYYKGVKVSVMASGMGMPAIGIYSHELFKAHVAPHVKIKAAGGISSLEDAEKFIELGADRLGTSRIVKIAKGLENDGTY